jgi:hypothetical protein
MLVKPIFFVYCRGGIIQARFDVLSTRRLGSGWSSSASVFSTTAFANLYVYMRAILKNNLLRISFLSACGLLLTYSMLLSTAAMAQERSGAVVRPMEPPPLPPGPDGNPHVPGRALLNPSQPVLAKHYADSAAFDALFPKLYVHLKPTMSIRERVDKQFKQLSRMFKARGIDSAEAYGKVMKELDTNADRETIYRTYRANLSAEEVKAYLAFVSTPAGKHILEVQPKLMSANLELDQYIHRAVGIVITPMQRPLTPPGAPMHGPHGLPGEHPNTIEAQPTPPPPTR